MKFHRVAKEGATADGRHIKAEHLDQMAKNYDPAKYSARVWIEHMRSIMPDGTFKAYGDVVALKTEKDTDGKTVLLAQIDPTDELKQINKNRQKLFSSIEIDTAFADTGEAYLVGLAVTDSPASLGTERLMFTATKQEPTHLFSVYDEFNLPSDDGILSHIKGFLDKFSKEQENTKAGERIELSAGFEMVIEHFNNELTKTETAFDNQIKELQAQMDDLAQKFANVQQELDSTPSPNNSTRPMATGTDNFSQTDC